jgi:hypothetical protein
VVFAQNETLTCSSWLLGDAFGVARPHHGNIELIWNELWRPMVRYYVFIFFAYMRSAEQEANMFQALIQEVPFYDANVDDFEPIFADLIEASLN